MSQKLKRLFSMVAAIVAVVPAMIFVQSVAGPGVASATCLGVNREAVMSLIVNGRLYVNERPTSGTCNNNNLYQGGFRNETGDPHWRAVVWIQNGGIWTPHRGGYDTAVHSYSFRDDNSHSLIQLCIDNFDVGSTEFCSAELTIFGF